MTKVNPEEYEAAWESVMDCVDGMKEEFSWSKDVIAKMLWELAEKVESEKDVWQWNELAIHFTTKRICRVSWEGLNKMKENKNKWLGLRLNPGTNCLLRLRRREPPPEK